MKKRSSSKLLLVLVLLAAASVLLFRLVTQSPSRTTLNVAALALFSFVSLLLLSPPSTLSGGETRVRPVYCIGICLLALIAYAPSINAPFLFDDYVHLSLAATEPWNRLIHRVLLEHPAGGDLFFRPVGSIYFWLLFKLAGPNAQVWHLGSLVIHAVNTLLVFRLAVKLCGRNSSGFLAALLFAFHASHVEAVSWVAAAFDLLSCLFVLLVLNLLASPWRSHLQTTLVILFSALACLSKESAYCLPLLVFITFRRGLPVLIASLTVFAYRAWYLQGLGGYHDASGTSLAFALHPLSIAQALFLRLWGALFLPLNWSENVGVAVTISAACLLFSLSVAAVRSLRPQRIPAAMLFTLLAALPVFPLLMIGADLSGARVLYLPSVGFCLLFARIFDSLHNKRVLAALASSLLLFHLAALLHNETIWVNVARTAHLACGDAAALLQRDSNSSIYAYGLPKTRHGVYFLQNGFPQCVDPSRVTSGPQPRAPLSPHEHIVHWDESAGRLKEDL